MIRQRKWLWLAAGMAILVAISASRYQAVMLRSREAVLGSNLTALRVTIKQYLSDKQRAPQSLQDLVGAGYFQRELPIDPTTNSRSSWTPVIENVVISSGKTVRGITDVHSGSSSISSKGTAYSAW